MDISAALAAHLATLSETLDHDHDLETGLRALNTDLKTAVDSYLAMTMTIALAGHDVSFTVTQDPTTVAGVAEPGVAASLLIPLPALTDTQSGSSLVLYAATPGAFVDLAADISFALALDPATLIADQHMVAPDLDPQAGMTGLDRHSTINQAVGVLIEEGHTPESAHEQLHRLAAADHGDLHAAAAQIIARLTGHATDPA